MLVPSPLSPHLLPSETRFSLLFALIHWHVFAVVDSSLAVVHPTREIPIVTGFFFYLIDLAGVYLPFVGGTYRSR